MYKLVYASIYRIFSAGFFKNKMADTTCTFASSIMAVFLAANVALLLKFYLGDSGFRNNKNLISLLLLFVFLVVQIVNYFLFIKNNKYKSIIKSHDKSSKYFTSLVLLWMVFTGYCFSVLFN